MATDKPRIQAYIRQDIYDKLEEYKKSTNRTESQAIEFLLAKVFGFVVEEDSFYSSESILRDAVQELLEQNRELTKQLIIAQNETFKNAVKQGIEQAMMETSYTLSPLKQNQ